MLYQRDLKQQKLTYNRSSFLTSLTIWSEQSGWKGGSAPLCFFQWSCMDVRVGLSRKLSTKELMLLKCGVGEDS